MRRPGRKPIGGEQPSVQLNVRLSPSTFDAVYERARRQRVTMVELVRQVLDRELREADRDEDE